MFSHIREDSRVQYPEGIIAIKLCEKYIHTRELDHRESSGRTQLGEGGGGGRFTLFYQKYISAYPKVG